MEAPKEIWIQPNSEYAREYYSKDYIGINGYEKYIRADIAEQQIKELVIELNAALKEIPRLEQQIKELRDRYKGQRVVISNLELNIENQAQQIKNLREEVEFYKKLIPDAERNAVIEYKKKLQNQ